MSNHYVISLYEPSSTQNKPIQQWPLEQKYHSTQYN